jgi:hypothetical protein
VNISTVARARAVELICVSESGGATVYKLGMIQNKQRRERRPTASIAERQERKALQEIEGRAAMAEYKEQEQAVRDRMAKLRKAREDRERASGLRTSKMSVRAGEWNEH